MSYHETLATFINERNRYLEHPENAILQEKEMNSIAHSILSIAKAMNADELTAEENEAVDWAKEQLDWMGK